MLAANRVDGRFSGTSNFCEGDVTNVGMRTLHDAITSSMRQSRKWNEFCKSAYYDFVTISIGEISRKNSVIGDRTFVGHDQVLCVHCDLSL
jgi:thioredoxin reductase